MSRLLVYSLLRVVLTAALLIVVGLLLFIALWRLVLAKKEENRMYPPKLRHILCDNLPHPSPIVSLRGDGAIPSLRLRDSQEEEGGISETSLGGNEIIPRFLEKSTRKIGGVPLDTDRDIWYDPSK